MQHISIPAPTTFNDILAVMVHEGGMPVALVLALAIFAVAILGQTSRLK
jgi:hypothetical protein